MIDKMKVSEVAKNLGTTAKEISGVLEKKFPGETKKSASNLSKDELNYIFEYYTQNDGKSLESYNAIKKEDAPKAKAAPKSKTVKTADKAEKASAATAETTKVAKETKKETKTVAEKTDTVKKVEVAESAPKTKESVKEEAPVVTKTEVKPVENTETKPAVKEEVKKPTAPATQSAPTGNAQTSTPTRTYNNNNNNNGNRTYNNNNNGGGYNNNNNNGNRTYNNNNNGGGYNNNNNNGNRTYNNNNNGGGYNNNNNNGNRTYNNNNNNGGGYNNNNNNNGNRTYNNNNNGERRPYNNDRRPYNNNNGQQPKPAPVAPVFDDSKPLEIKMQQPKKKNKDANAATPRSTQTTQVVVDMRSSEVNLDKYNEKYEKIAPAPALKDNVVKKQKFNSRNNRRGKPFKSKREREEEKLHNLELERQRRQRIDVEIPEEISVGELAGLLKVQASEIVKRLMPLGMMAAISDVIDYDTAALVAMEIGAKVSREVVVTIEERLFVEDGDDDNSDPRPPIVVVMGHVDHGKTSLLDAIRNADVATGEAGGITQHIGAYQVYINKKPITFLDTPGHAAFTSMRARGAQVTDIAILVVAADDGIMPQTIEAIDHAKAAGVNIIVAINKMDKPDANPDKIMQQLTEHELVPEEWGGDVICVPVSAKGRMGIENLLEMVQLSADMQELKANSDRAARGTVIEAKLDKGRGPIATVLVQNGTLKTGDIIIAGTAVGRVRVMMNDRGQKVDTAGPSMPVEITGLAEVPAAGDLLNAVADEKLARELVEQRREEAKQEVFRAYQKVTLDNLFDQISEGEMKELPIIIKGDVQGSVEAVKQSLMKLTNEEVRVRVIHGGVGAVSESDVMLAEASGAIIVGFNVRPDPVVMDSAEHAGVDIRLYRIIYDAIEEIEAAMKGMLDPKYKDEDLGRAEVREVYKITGVGQVAGCYVLGGKIVRSAKIRIVRDGILIGEDTLKSLKRFKDDVKEVGTSFECGVTLDKFTDIKVGDILEAYETIEIKD